MLAIIGFLEYFILLLMLQECKSKNYCSANICNNTKQHTLCKFPEWNEELEASAQRWANQCVKHSTPDIKDTCRDLGPMSVGQNIATVYGESPGLSPLSLVDVWYMQLLNVNASILPRYRRSSDAGYSFYEYFTQLVWANSRQVGCGGVKFKERLQESGNGKRRVIYRLVCNFAPAGNVRNESVYRTGPPCSRCPQQTCDAHYFALCSSITASTTALTEETEDEISASTIKPSTGLIKLERTSYETKTTNLEESEAIHTTKKEDEEFKPYDYFSHLPDYVRPSLDTTVKKITSCKDLLVIDEFVDLLKKKLSTDPMFKTFIQTTALNVGSDNSYTDAMALLSGIYSTKTPSTTPYYLETDYLNSTLLVDLVEAVIFRSGDKEKVTQESIRFTQPEMDVSPIKIQAELAAVRRNEDFTGHLFFPEDVEGDDTRIESTESYYDVTNPSLPDFELQAIKRAKATKDFLDEILDSETVTSEIQDETNVVISKREVKRGVKMNNGPDSHQSDYYDNIRQDFISDYNRVLPKSFKKDIHHSHGVYSVKYSDLLRKLAADLKALKLNNMFHCTRNNSQKSACSLEYFFIMVCLANNPVFNFV